MMDRLKCQEDDLLTWMVSRTISKNAPLIGVSLTSSNHNEMLATVKISGLNSFELCRIGSLVLIIWKVHEKRLGKIDARRAGVTSWVLWQLLPLHWTRSETLFEKGRVQHQREFALQIWKWSSQLLTPSKNGWNTWPETDVWSPKSVVETNTCGPFPPKEVPFITPPKSPAVGECPGRFRTRN